MNTGNNKLEWTFQGMYNYCEVTCNLLTLKKNLPTFPKNGCFPVGDYVTMLREEVCGPGEANFTSLTGVLQFHDFQVVFVDDTAIVGLFGDCTAVDALRLHLESHNTIDILIWSEEGGRDGKRTIEKNYDLLFSNH